MSGGDYVRIPYLFNSCEIKQVKLKRLSVFCCCFDFKILLYLVSFFPFFINLCFFLNSRHFGNRHFGTVDILGIDILVQ